MCDFRNIIAVGSIPMYDEDGKRINKEFVWTFDYLGNPITTPGESEF